MSLYFVPGDRFVDPVKVEQSDVIQAVKREAHWKSFQRLLKTYQEGLDWVVANGGNVIWTKTGALFGHGSKRPHSDVEHVWTTIIDAVGDDRLCLITAGTFLKLVVAQRPERHWLCTASPTGHLDPLTGDVINTLEYWLNPAYQSPAAKRAPSIEDLKAHWGIGV